MTLLHIPVLLMMVCTTSVKGALLKILNTFQLKMSILP